jgi:hypothetical protein
VSTPANGQGRVPHRPTTATRVASLISKHIDATKICSMRGSLPCDPHRCKPGSATEPKFSSRGSFTPDGKRRVPPKHQDHEGRCRCRTWSPRPRQHTSPSFRRRKMAPRGRRQPRSRYRCCARGSFERWWKCGGAHDRRSARADPEGVSRMRSGLPQVSASSLAAWGNRSLCNPPLTSTTLHDRLE